MVLIYQYQNVWRQYISIRMYGVNISVLECMVLIDQYHSVRFQYIRIYCPTLLVNGQTLQKYTRYLIQIKLQSDLRCHELNFNTV